MLTTQFIDFSRTSRKYTDEGYLIVPARLARTGIQEYRAYELGLTDREPMSIVRIYRAADEVFHPDAVSSFEGKPVTDNHPDQFVDASNWTKLSKGFARNIQRDGMFLTAELIVTDKAVIEKVNRGKVQISNGYTADYDWTPGTTPEGEAYDAQQKNIRGNHVAIVDAARCGPACRVGDHQPTGAKPMAVKKVTIDGIPFEMEEAAAAAVEKLVADRDAHKQARDAAPKLAQVKIGDKTVNVDNAEPILALMADHQAEVEKLKKDVITPEQRDALVSDWAQMITDAKRLAPAVDTKGKTCDAIRRAVLAEVCKDEKRKGIVDAALAGKKIEDASADTIKLAFNVIAAAPGVASQSKASDPVADALRRDTDDKAPKVVGRDAYIANLNAHQNQE